MQKRKSKNVAAAAHSLRGGAGAGPHKNKGTRGTGKGAGKWARHPKHKKNRS